MKYNYNLLLLLLVFTLSNCKNAVLVNSSKVTNEKELIEAIKNATAGSDIVLSNGIWEDIQIRFVGKGTADKPITLRAETPGKVIIQGESDLKLAGEYLIVSGLHFKNGFSPSRAVIEFRTDENNNAFHSQIVNCVIEDFNKAQRNMSDLWVQFSGRHNKMDHCYIAGKSNRGPTVRVTLAGNESIKNYHEITNNHFGPRAPKGGPSAETIQIGNSYTSMAPSYTLVANNLFDRCNGEVEVISSKTNFNEFRNNVFYKSEGSLVTRHGNYCIVDGNYFIGDENSENIGGVRLIGSGHWVTNNYFYNLKGENFRSPLAVMNGIPKSPLNRYIQVTDVVVAYNSWINCKAPLQFGVGSNVDQKDVLPASEIRSARPIRTTVANNLIYNTAGDAQPVVAHDKLDGINFQSNVINNQGTVFENIEGLKSMNFEVSAINEYLKAAKGIEDIENYSGFEFDKIKKDLFGSDRKDNNRVGAITKSNGQDPDILNKDKYGPEWYSAVETEVVGKTHLVSNPIELTTKIAAAKNGDIIQLNPGNYDLTQPLRINKTITIQSEAKSKTRINYSGNSATPVFEMNPKGQLTLKNIYLSGTGTQYAFAPLKNNMSSLYNLAVENCEISNFDFILKGYKYSFADNIRFTFTVFKNAKNGLELSEEIEDKGEYNAENIFIDNCTFDSIQENVIDYYRGGYDESTVGGNLKITNSTFMNSGAREKSGILINTYGIINVHLGNNTFKNNSVKLIALLWGAKNNTHQDNSITNSGKIVVEENLKLKLLY